MIPDHDEFLLIKCPAWWNTSPTFHLGQRVQIDQKSAGTVMGLDYVAPGTWEHQQQIQLGWHYKVVWDECCSRSSSHPVELCHQSEIQPLLTPVGASYTKQVAISV